MPASQRFVILSSGRTGSTLLSSLLDSHPEVACFGEILNKEKILWNRNELNKLLDADKTRAIRDADPSGFVRMVFRLGEEEPGVTAVGFKTIYTHFSYDKRHRLVLPTLLDMDNLKVLHNKRRNLFKTFCSYEVAAKRREQGKFMNAYRREDGEDRVSVRVDPEACLRFMDRTRAEEERFAALFGSKEILDVYYEDLAKRTALEMRGVLDFLSLPYAPMKPGTYKVRKQPIQEVVENYDQVRQRLTEEGFGRFFEEDQPLDGVPANKPDTGARASA